MPIEMKYLTPKTFMTVNNFWQAQESTDFSAINLDTFQRFSLQQRRQVITGNHSFKRCTVQRYMGNYNQHTK